MRAYELLLRAYPASFRNEYGGEMRALFALRLRGTAGPLALLVLWLQTIGEVLSNAALVHGDLLRQDLSYTMRVLRRTPGFAITAVLVVALGIGATTAAFSVTDFVLIRPLPFPDGDRLVKLWEREPAYTRMELSPANYRDWTKAAASFERIGAYYTSAINLLGRAEPLHLDGAAVNADLLPALGVRPLLGRLFTAAEDRAGAQGTVLLSYRLWQTEFGGDPGVVGRPVVLDGSLSYSADAPSSVPYVVIGVMPREFHFPSSDIALWTAMRLGESAYQDRSNNVLESVGRLNPGVSLKQARAEMTVIAAQSARQYPQDNEHVGASVFPLGDEVSQQSRVMLEALLGAAACVLLIACANLANLLLVRALGRRRELAVRAAMGAGRERLVRQLMTESLLLATVGGALGVAIAIATVPLLARLVPTTLPIAETPAVDVRVLLFAAGLTAITGIGFGLAPVVRVGRTDLHGLREGSRSGGGHREHLRSALVVAEIMASVVLLVSAGLLMRALLAVQATDPGFKPDGVLTMRTAMPQPQYKSATARDAFYTRTLSKIRTLPGVSGAAYISALPMVWGGGIWPVSIDGRPRTRADNENASLRYVTPGFFDALGIPLERGRDVSDSDGPDRQYVAVVSESLARRYFPNQDPIGRHFTFALDERTVIGVVGDTRVRGLERPSEPQVYLPYKQVGDGSLIAYIPKDLAIRTSVAPATLVPSIRAIIRQVDPDQPISDVRTLSDIIDLETVSRATQVRILAAFAVIAFVLAGIGIHGLLSFAVSQRTQEIGVRMALGAQASDIFSMVTRRSMVLAAAGIVPGVALAYAAGRGMEALLAGVRPADAFTMTGAIALSIAMTAAGSVLPTLRALRVDPMTALRSE